jgi:hypothetical protein
MHTEFLIALTGGIRIAQLLYQLGYGLDDQEIMVKFLTGANFFSLPLGVQTSSGAHPAQVKDAWTYTSTSTSALSSTFTS